MWTEEPRDSSVPEIRFAKNCKTKSYSGTREKVMLLNWGFCKTNIRSTQGPVKKF